MFDLPEFQTPSITYPGSKAVKEKNHVTSGVGFQTIV
jgi:hypothetical protein